MIGPLLHKPNGDLDLYANDESRIRLRFKNPASPTKTEKPAIPSGDGGLCISIQSRRHLAL
jgi:hypothetical protein